MRDYDNPPYIKMPLSELTKPQGGRMVYGPSWWAKTEDDCVLFYRGYWSPQCNASKDIIRRIHKDLTPVFVEVAFVPHDCNDYWLDRRAAQERP